MIPPKKPGYTRVCHTADNHLRDSHLGVLRRGADFTAALNAAVDAAITHKCDFIVNGGDILNASRPSSGNIADLVMLDNKLRQAKLPMLVISGNHDMADPPWIDAILAAHRVPGDAGNLDDGGLIPADNKRFNLHGLEVECVPFMVREYLEPYLREKPKADIMVWHGTVQELVGFPAPSAPTYGDMHLAKWRVVMMGDIHRRNYDNVEGTIIGYSGATELVAKNDPLEYSVEIFDIPTFPGACVDHYQCIIPTRKILTFTIGSENQLNEVLTKIEDQIDKNPIIFVSYNKHIDNVLARLKTVATPERCILRAEPYVTGGHLSAVSLGSAPVLRPLADFAEGFFQASPHLAPLARQLCDENNDPNVLLSEFIDKRMSELHNPNLQSTH